MYMYICTHYMCIMLHFLTHLPFPLIPFFFPNSPSSTLMSLCVRLNKFLWGYLQEHGWDAIYSHMDNLPSLHH